MENIDDLGVLDALEARYQKVQETLQQPFGPPVERTAAPKGRVVSKNSKFAVKTPIKGRR